jgi:hypothetical protein
MSGLIDMKELVAYFKRWGKLTPVFSETMRPGEFTLDNMSRLNGLGRKLLHLFWCRYVPIEVELIWKNGGYRIKTEQITVFECVPGIIPKLVRRMN